MSTHLPQYATFWQGGGSIDAKYPDEWQCLRSQWKYVVDAARFGQYFYGTPPKLLRFYDRVNGIDIHSRPLEWRKDELGRDMPYWNGLRLLNFHVHGKNVGEVRPGFELPPERAGTPSSSLRATD